MSGGAWPTRRFVTCLGTTLPLRLFLPMNTEDGLPQDLTLAYDKVYDLRYGENPHQKGALYRPAQACGGLPNAALLHGKALSFNNIMDADAAWRVVTDFKGKTVAIIKHSNPCGLASHASLVDAYRRAYQGDTVSAYGGIVGFNVTVDEETAEAMRGVFYEVVVAPDYTPEALALLRKRRNLRVLQIQGDDNTREYDLRPISGGLLVQTSDAGRMTHLAGNRSPPGNQARKRWQTWNLPGRPPNT